MTVNATTGDSTIAGTLDVTGLVTGIAGFSGDLTGNVVGDVTGNADTSTQWETTRTITMTGDVSADAVNIDGTGNVDITNTVIANDSHTHITSNITDLTTATTGITKVGTILVGVWQGTAITSANINSITTSQISDLTTASTGITDVGTIDTGVWQGTAIADGFVANDITLTNITQITTRNHVNLQSIDVDDHHNQRTQNMTFVNTAKTSHTKNGAGTQTWTDYDAYISTSNTDITYANARGCFISSAAGTSGSTSIYVNLVFPDSSDIVVDSKGYSSPSGSEYNYFDFNLSSYLAKFNDGRYRVQIEINNGGADLDGTGQLQSFFLDIG